MDKLGSGCVQTRKFIRYEHPRKKKGGNYTPPCQSGNIKFATSARR